MRASRAIVCLMATVAARRLMIHVVRVVVGLCVGPRRSARVVRWALSIRAFIHHSVVVVTHLNGKIYVVAVHVKTNFILRHSPVNNSDPQSM